MHCSWARRCVRNDHGWRPLGMMVRQPQLPPLKQQHCAAQEPSSSSFLWYNHNHHHGCLGRRSFATQPNHNDDTTKDSPSIPPPPSSSSSSSNNNTTTTTSTTTNLVAETTTDEVEATAALGKHTAKQTTTTTTTHQRQPRPLFPWRHAPLDAPLPRLLPDTPAYRDDVQYKLSPRTERFIAWWFLNVPAIQALTDLDGWKQEMADGGAYAFQQAVGGILSNVYRWPVTLERNQKNDDDDDGSDRTSKGGDGDDARIRVGVVPPPCKANETESSETTKEKGEPNWLNAIEKENDSTGTTTVDGTDTSHAASAPSNSSDSNAPSSERPKETATSSSEQKTAAVANDTEDTDTKAESPEPSQPNNPDFPDVRDMMIPPLRKLYEAAAHKQQHGSLSSSSSSDPPQFTVQLEVQVVKAHCYNLLAYPYTTRADVQATPERLETMKTLQSLGPQAGFATLANYLEEDLQRKGQLETTVEMQVVVVCQEIFRVVDGVTGEVVQGTHDASEQTVSHLVRMEATSTQHVTSSGNVYSVGNWQITDLDDLLAPKPWYY